VSQWRVLAQRYVLKLPFFAVRVDKVQTATGVVFEDFPIIESRDWVCVVALDAEGRAVMVQQYRHGVGRQTLEFPAGRIDPGESPEAAAHRELLEETGHAAGQLQLLRSVCPDTTRARHQAHIFLATGVVCSAPQDLEPGEEVSVCKRALDEPTLEAELSHAVHVLALHLARSALSGGRPGTTY
jgi:8-oxo-dGTP pyrophosphatase MutT (NUDIX family)